LFTHQAQTMAQRLQPAQKERPSRRVGLGVLHSSLHFQYPQRSKSNLSRPHHLGRFTPFLIFTLLYTCQTSAISTSWSRIRSLISLKLTIPSCPIFLAGFRSSFSFSTTQLCWPCSCFLLALPDRPGDWWGWSSWEREVSTMGSEGLRGWWSLLLGGVGKEGSVGWWGSFDKFRIFCIQHTLHEKNLFWCGDPKVPGCVISFRKTAK